MTATTQSRPSELIIVMGLGDMTLSDRLEQCPGGIPGPELFEYMEAAARAIDFLNSPRHDLGRGPVSPIQHCDIKPQNILVVGGSAQVCDFGFARAGRQRQDDVGRRHARLWRPSCSKEARRASRPINIR